MASDSPGGAGSQRPFDANHQTAQESSLKSVPAGASAPRAAATSWSLLSLRVE